MLVVLQEEVQGEELEIWQLVQENSRVRLLGDLAAYSTRETLQEEKMVGSRSFAFTNNT